MPQNIIDMNILKRDNKSPSLSQKFKKNHITFLYLNSDYLSTIQYYFYSKNLLINNHKIGIKKYVNKNDVKIL